MSSLKEHAIVVFTYDKNGVAIPDAVIEVIVSGRVFVKATTRGHRDTPTRVQVPADVEAVTLRATAFDRTKNATVRADVGTFTFSFEDIEIPPGQRVPAWFAKAGFISGAATLLFFMYVALGNVTRPTFAHQAVLSLGLALSFAFIGGDAAARGNLPVPLIKDSPVAFSVAGGVAVFVISLLLLRAVWS